jgi:hypothetical protein
MHGPQQRLTSLSLIFRSFPIKFVGRVASKRFSTRYSFYHLFPAQQSAYRSFHSTETAELSVHNYLVRAIDKGQVPVLVLLNLSVAFYTIDHDIMLTALERQFGVNDTAMNGFSSYLGDIRLQRPAVHRVLQRPAGRLHSLYSEDTSYVFAIALVYAGDIQLFVSCRPSSTDDIRRHLSRYAAGAPLAVCS